MPNEPRLERKKDKKKQPQNNGEQLSPNYTIKTKKKTKGKELSEDPSENAQSEERRRGRKARVELSRLTNLLRNRQREDPNTSESHL